MNKTLGLLSALCLCVSVVPFFAADADNLVPSKKVTLSGQMPLRDALAALKKQTGLDVVDQTGAADVKVKVDLKGATFWEALEAIAKEADARVLPNAGESAVALVEGPYKGLPISFAGPFRTVVKRIASIRDLETDAHFTLVSLEVAWEPGVKPFFLDMPPKGLVVEDEKMRPLKVENEGSGRAPIAERAVEVNLRLAGVPRTTAKVAVLKGTVNLIGPTKWLAFEFKELAKASLTQDGVTAKLSKVNLVKDRWDVEISLEYPGDGPKLESFEVGDFVAFNECLLKKGDKVVPFGGYQTEGGAGAKAVVLYQFPLDDNKEAFGANPDPKEWSVIYKAPGPMKEIPVKFEFKDLLLP
jgi:hypothetical protein